MSLQIFVITSNGYLSNYKWERKTFEDGSRLPFQSSQDMIFCYINYDN